MKRYIAILGTLLIVGVFLSGSAVAMTWHYAVYIDDSADCTNIGEILGVDDDVCATLGVNSPQQQLGFVIVDFDSYPMGVSQDFTVFAVSTFSERYTVWVMDPEKNTPIYIGTDYDTADHDFTTPSTPGGVWQYVLLVGETGGTPNWTDPIYGPEIDAVGWFECP